MNHTSSHPILPEADTSIMPREIDFDSNFKDKVIKLIPGEVVAAYLVVQGIIPPSEYAAKWVSLSVAAVLLGLIPVYLRRFYGVRNYRQIVFTMGSFVVWLYSLGGPFAFWSFSANMPLHVPWIGSIVLILWTLLIPLYVNSVPVVSAANTQEALAVPVPAAATRAQQVQSMAAGVGKRHRH